MLCYILFCQIFLFGKKTETTMKRFSQKLSKLFLGFEEEVADDEKGC